MTNDELGNALKSLLPGTEKTIQLMGNSSNGANVVLCTEQGFRVSLHEVLVRRFTNLLDAFEATVIEEMRDPFGTLVIVLQGVQGETLMALAQLLYTGECLIQSEGAEETLKEILALGVNSELSGSPEVNAEFKPSTQSSNDHPPCNEQVNTEDQQDNLTNHLLETGRLRRKFFNQLRQMPVQNIAEQSAEADLIQF